MRRRRRRLRQWQRRAREIGLFELFCEMFLLLLLLQVQRPDVLVQLMIVPVEELGTKKGRKSDVLTRVHDPFRDAILRDAIFEFKAFVSETSSDVG